MLLDLKTLTLMVMVSSILYAITIAFFATQANQYKGITIYMWGAICAAIGFLFTSINTGYASVLLNLLTSYFFITSGYLYCLGIARFFNSEFNLKKLSYILGLFFIIQSYLVLNKIKVIPNLAINVYIIILYSIACYHLWRHRNMNFANTIYFMLVNLVLIILIFIARIYFVLFYGIGLTLENNAFNHVFFFTVFITAYLRNVGFIMMVSHRLYLDLREAALYDFLTRVYNRRATQQLLDEYFKGFKNNSYNCALILLDIDYFKVVNDNYGHEVGDKVLQAVVRILKSQLRKTDILGRWGGEEFLIVLPNTGLKEAILLAEKLRIAVASDTIAGITCTISLGVNTFGAHDPHVDVSIKHTDDALYEAKNKGRNCVAEYINL